jgi:hypothetical protein
VDHPNLRGTGVTSVAYNYTLCRARISRASRTISSMTSSSELVSVDLTDRERKFIEQALQQWGWSASSAPFPFQVLGLSTWEQFGELTVRLQRAVENGDPLSNLDWARVLFITEITWASGLVGAGLDFATVTGFSDAEAITLLRGLQRRRKIGGYDRAKLLFPDGGRTRTAEEIEELERWGEKVRREQQGRQYPAGL